MVCIVIFALMTYIDYKTIIIYSCGFYVVHIDKFKYMCITSKLDMSLQALQPYA